MRSQEFPCPRCRGTGRVSAVIKPVHGKSEPSDHHRCVIQCPQLGCHNGLMNRGEYYKSWKEES